MKRELWVVEELRADDQWHPRNRRAWQTRADGERDVGLCEADRVVLYLPVDTIQAAVVRGQIAALEELLGGLRWQFANGSFDDCGGLEKAIRSTLERIDQLRSPDAAGGKGGTDG